MSEALSTDEYQNLAKGYHPESDRSWSINTRCYREPKFEDIEREQIFHKSWQFLCHEEKLREPGSYLAADIHGQSIFANRDKNGKLKAFYNVCKHRGHELVNGEGRKNLIVCPYHAWTYNLDGTLRGAPKTGHIQDFDTDKICLSSVRLEVFSKLVFVNLDPLAKPLFEQTGELANEIRQYAPDLGQLTHAHRLTYKINANWKAVVDNFLECYHCPTAHRDFCTLIEMDTYKVKTHGIYSSHMAKAGRSGNKAYAIEDASVTDHAVWFLWPNITLMRYPGRGNFMVWRFYPAGPKETYEVFDFFLETKDPNEAEIEAIKFVDEVLQPEDIGLVESVQRGMQTPAFVQGRYVVDEHCEGGMSEHAVHHFHGLVLDAYKRACKT